MDYKKTAGYRIGVVCAAIGILMVLIKVVQTFGPDLGLGFVNTGSLVLGFLLIGFFLMRRAKRRADQEEDTKTEDQLRTLMDDDKE